ncbi:hypothetical protein HHK36_022979 [Tetracentron sinense]|uniref:Two-component response regulator n=1 Tax=Tetracentron sinense TaxID=13715 RepID=A0A834YVV1_TETSI|nr:hypothetical protein HHK36_022979 [Tetracentron sinense]
MNVPGITRENVASHLQKYRLYLRRLSGVSQHQNGLNMPFMDPQEANLRPMPSLDGLDLQALATLQAGFGRSTANSGLGMPLVDQRNLFGSEMPILRFGEGQQMGNCSKQMNLLHELPTSMEPKQLAQFHQSVQTLGSMGLQVSEGVSGILKLPTPVRTTSSSAHVDSVRRVQSSSSLMQMAQPWSRGPVLNEIAGGHGSGLPSPIRQPIFSNEISGRALGRNGTLLNARGATHNPLSQASSMVNFPTNHVTEFPMNGSPLGSASGISALTLTDVFQEGGNSEIKGSIGFAPSFDIFDELHQCKPQDWQLQDVGLQGNLDLLPSALSHQGFISSQKNGQNRNKTIVGKTMVSLGEEYENGNPENIAQRHSNLLINNSFRVKSESMPDLSCENVLFGEQFGQDDLMTALLKQQQEDGLDESEFNLDGYPMDNIPV